MNKISWLNKDCGCECGASVEFDVMYESQTSKEVKITLPKDSIIEEHTAPGQIKIQVLVGKIWFAIGEKKTQLEIGDMLIVDAKIPHSLGGIEKSIARLSLEKK